MNKNMIKIMSTVLALVMVLMLGGCSGAQKAQDATTTAAGETQGATTAAPTEAKKVTITFAEHVADINTQSPHVAAIVKAFMVKYPNVTIDMNGTEVTEHMTKMKMAAQSGTLPDMVWLEAPTAKEMVAAGYLADLTSEIQSRGMNDYFQPGMIDACTVDGKIYGLPSEPLACGLWYNKAIFAKYNVQLPTTYEELLAAAKVFKQNGVVAIAQGAKSNFSVWAFQAMLARFGFFDKLDNLLSGKEKWDNADFIKFYGKVKELTDAGAFPTNVANLDYFQAVEMFMGGNAAMLDAGAWETSKLEKSAVAKDVGFWFGPTFSDGVGEQNIGIKAPGGPYCVSAESAKDPDKMKAIMDFWQFFYGPEGTKIVAEDNMILPTSKYNGTIDKEKTPVFATMLEAMNNSVIGVKEPFAQLPTATGQALFDSIYGVINKTYTPEQAAKYVEDTLARERQ
jgi:ABC-type sugar transport system, periplasmic component